MSEMFLAPDQKGGEKTMLRKLNQENQFLLKRVKDLYRTNELIANECLFHQQIAIQAEARILEEQKTLEEQITLLEETLERKEYFLQLKEKKWGELEKLLEEFAIDDDEFKDRLADLRI